MPILKNWSVVSTANDPYKAPEQCPLCLNGYVYNHPLFSDGVKITTSRIVGKRDGKIVTFSGSEYTLADIDSGYEKHCPDVRKRLFDSLKELKETDEQ